MEEINDILNEFNYDELLKVQKLLKKHMLKYNSYCAIIYHYDGDDWEEEDLCELCYIEKPNELSSKKWNSYQKRIIKTFRRKKFKQAEGGYLQGYITGVVKNIHSQEELDVHAYDSCVDLICKKRKIEYSEYMNDIIINIFHEYTKLKPY